MQDEPTITIGNIVMRLIAKRAFINGIHVPLRPREYEYLRVLLEYADTIVTHDMFIRLVYTNKQPSSIMTMVTVNSLRKKIYAVSRDCRIDTVRNKGYMFSVVKHASA